LNGVLDREVFLSRVVLAKIPDAPRKSLVQRPNWFFPQSFEPVHSGIAAALWIDLILGDALVFSQLTKFAYQSIPFTNPVNVTTAIGTTRPAGNDPFPFG